MSALFMKTWVINARWRSLTFSHTKFGGILVTVELGTDVGCWGSIWKGKGIFGGIFKYFRAR